jgi:aspartyl-tRNA(Asn)/glutamyl-tRNA(Gln) amidotransferase subunit A
MAALADLTVLEALQMMQKGQVSSRELTSALLERIDHLEPALHVFITLTPEKAMEQAERADKRMAAWRKNPQEALPPLLGLPMAIKDVLCVAGIPCTCGSRILENFVPPYSATAVEKLLQAGAIILGKTNMDEFAMGSSTENSAYGPTRNPWDTGRVPGGSSGGSAAGVAAHLFPAALGSDTGGSIRQPASFCGVTGLKPTYGRVSRYGLVAFGSSLDCVGVFAHDVADVRALFRIVAGHDPQDATSMDLPVPEIDLDSTSNLKGLRIGVPKEYFIGGIQQEVEQSVRKAISVLASLGAEIQEISLPHTEYALPVYYLVSPAEASANLARYDGVRFGLRASENTLSDLFRKTRGDGFGPEVKRRIMLGTYALSAGYYDAYYAQAQKVRTLIKDDFDQAFKQVDAIATPVAPTTAFRLGEHTNDPLAMYLEDVFTLPANLAGVPGLAFPVGFDDAGLPIGMQLMGGHFQEDLLIRVVHVYQQVTDWQQRQPAL